MEFKPNMIVRLIRLTCYSDNERTRELLKTPIIVKEVRHCSSCNKNHVYIRDLRGKDIDGDLDMDCVTKVNTYPIKILPKKSEMDMAEEKRLSEGR